MTLADHRSRRHVDQDGAEQGERDADAAENEVFPRRLQRLVRAVDADHQHGRQRGELDGHPHQADVVGEQPEVHGEHQHLVHGVVEAQIARREPADLQLVADVGRAEDGRREADEGREHDEDDIEIVDEEIAAGQRPMHQQRERRDQGRQRDEEIQARGQPVPGQQRQQRRPQLPGSSIRRAAHRVAGRRQRVHRRSPRKTSSA